MSVWTRTVSDPLRTHLDHGDMALLSGGGLVGGVALGQRSQRGGAGVGRRHQAPSQILDKGGGSACNILAPHE